MAATLGSLTTQILNDTDRDPNLYTTAVQNAIVTAIKFMESSFFYLFRKTASVVVPNATNSAFLPGDFSSLISAYYLVGTQGNTGLPVFSQSQGLQCVPYEELITLFVNSADIGQPYRYAIQAGTLYTYPNAAGDTSFTIIYYYKDATYPSSASDSSIWFNPQTIDIVRYIAMQCFIRDTLQAPEMAASFDPVIAKFTANLERRNNQQQVYNMMSI